MDKFAVRQTDIKAVQVVGHSPTCGGAVRCEKTHFAVR
jgi:hypothetical protein